MRIQTQCGARVGFGPAGEATLRKTFLTYPKPLAVVGQALNGVPTTRTEYEERAGLRVVRQRLAAERGQAIDALPEIDWLDCQQDPHVRRDLDHPRLQNAWAKPTTAVGS